MSLKLVCGCGKRIVNPLKEKRVKTLRKDEKVLLKCPNGHDNYAIKTGNGKIKLVS